MLRYIGYISVRSCLCYGISVTLVLGRVCVTVYRLQVVLGRVCVAVYRLQFVLGRVCVTVYRYNVRVNVVTSEMAKFGGWSHNG